ncbi:MAG TPA: hypothetical protein VKA26_12455 [Ignavibacteriaceae bacterium]|nr:hypothetical protein [Ignavibacteriaceae bacterium]
MKKFLFSAFAIVVFFSLLLTQINCSTATEQKTMTKDEQIAHGEYLVNLGGCNDCHSPKVMTAMGPMPDTTRLLSGHPADVPVASIDQDFLKKGEWVLTDGKDFTTWVGPWGVSFTANLTPDKPTGTGVWTEDIFINAMRTGKHMGMGRQILPPMPWMFIAKCTDQDLKDIFAYLQSIPAINNQVPDPIPPDKMGPLFAKK